MATPEEKQAYVDEMVRKRGYVLDYHKVMARHDFDVLQAANGLVDAAYLKERRLDRKTKELIFIASLTAMRANRATSRVTYVCPGSRPPPKRRSSRPSRSPCPRRGSSHSRKGSRPGRRWLTPKASNRPSMHTIPELIRTGRTFLPQAIRTATPSNPSLAGGNRRMTSGSWPGTT